MAIVCRKHFGARHRVAAAPVKALQAMWAPEFGAESVPAELPNFERPTESYLDSGRPPSACSGRAPRPPRACRDWRARRAALPVCQHGHDLLHPFMPKSIVSVALMTLDEQGLFQLDDPIAYHIRTFANTGVHERGGARRRPAAAYPRFRRQLRTAWQEPHVASVRCNICYITTG